MWSTADTKNWMLPSRVASRICPYHRGPRQAKQTFTLQRRHGLPFSSGACECLYVESKKKKIKQKTKTQKKTQRFLLLLSHRLRKPEKKIIYKTKKQKIKKKSLSVFFSSFCSVIYFIFFFPNMSFPLVEQRLETFSECPFAVSNAGFAADPQGVLEGAPCARVRGCSPWGPRDPALQPEHPFDSLLGLSLEQSVRDSLRPVHFVGRE